MRINHNISSMHTQSSLFKANRSMSKSIEKLSTGLRINRASDDAAGLAVSEKLRTQVRGMGQALKNTQDAIALLNIADGALEEQASILQRMRELVLQAKNDTYTQTERNYMGTEFSALVKELDRIAAVTNYNGMRIFAAPEAAYPASGLFIYSNNRATKTPHEIAIQRNVFDVGSVNDTVFGPNDYSSSNHFNMMIGANFEAADAAAYNQNVRSYDRTASDMVTVQFGQMDASGILNKDVRGWASAQEIYDGFSWHPDMVDPEYDWEDDALNLALGGNGTLSDKLDLMLKVIDGDAVDSTVSQYLFTWAQNNSNVTGLDRVNRMRGSIGAMVNRFEHSISNLVNQINNTQAAESLIRDADFAQETAQFTAQKILTQSATAMLSQANLVPQGVLSLLG